MILNYPGPPTYISMEKFAAGKARARKYRNRRIGEFFKEIDLSEKQATGISKILRVLKNNGSPKPEFDTDNDRTFLETTIRIHDGFEMSEKNSENLNNPGDSDITMSDNMSDKVSDKMSELEKKRIKIIIENMTESGISSREAADILGVEQKTANRLLAKAVINGILEQTGGNKNRRYIKNKKDFL